MAYNNMNDYELIKLYASYPEEALRLINEKYKDKVQKIDALANNLSPEYSTDVYIEKYLKDEKQLSILNTQYKGSIEALLEEYLKRLIEQYYQESTRELSMGRYAEYLLMIIGKSEDELLAQQMAAFNYVEGALTSEEDQIYDSLVMLESYCFDLEQNEIVFSPEEKTIINATIREIRECMEAKDFETAKFKLVSLQMLMNLDVRFLRTLKRIISFNLRLGEFVDYRNDNQLGNDNSRTKGR